MGNWAVTKIAEIADVNPRLAKDEITGDIPVSFVPMASVGAGDGTIDVAATRPYSAVQKGFTSFKEGDVLFAKITPCMENGKMAVVPEVTGGHGFGSTEFHVLRPRKGIESGYLYYFVSSKKFRVDAEHNMTGAVGQRRVPTPYLAAYEIPLPPTAEQKRIVAKIEEIFSELDKGIESFKTAREQLKVYRQALLKHAFEGKLTAAWREENQDKLETADALLKRIQTERADRYRQQVKEWEKAVKAWEKSGKKGRKPGKPSKPKELSPLTAEDLADLPKLPEGWGWVKVGGLCDVVRGGSPRPAGDPKFYGGNIPFLKVADITNNSGPYVKDYSYSIKEAGLKKTRQIKPNTLLLSNSGATLGVPKICIIDATLNDGLAAFLNLREESLLFHYYFWESKTKELRAINQGAAQPNLNTDLIKDVAIPFCSVEEQSELIEKLEACLTEVEYFDQTITTALQQAETLRQSILKKAFSGQLVPQDPDDESAAALLARIRAERGGEATPGSNPRSKKAGPPAGSPLQKPRKPRTRGTS